MATNDLTKMVEEWEATTYPKLRPIIKAMAAEIEANREEIDTLKTRLKSYQSKGVNQ